MDDLEIYDLERQNEIKSMLRHGQCLWCNQPVADWDILSGPDALFCQDHADTILSRWVLETVREKRITHE